jgi:hypothetical protein
MEETVKVYAFEVWSQEKGEYVMRRLKRPADRIYDFQNARIIPGTDETVGRSKLDQHGQYHPSQ